MRSSLIFAVLFTLCQQAWLSISAQTLPVGLPVYEDYYRRAQLLGETDSSVSFTIRPIFPNSLKNNTKYLAGDSLPGLTRRTSFSRPLFSSLNNIDIRLLPLTFQSQVTSHHPYGWNDGPVIPAKGIQTMISAGIFMQYKYFSLQLKPEMVAAENARFKGFPSEYQIETWATAYDYYYNLIDAPERFGTGAYTRSDWGQSSLRFTFDPVSIGLSNENLWWGPGRRNSLLMSNNAPGFKHLTINTVRPVHTPAGSFEAQIIAGRLEDSGYPPPGADSLLYGVPIYKARNPEWRRLTGLILTYQPKWVPGLFLGYARTSQSYRSSDPDLPFLLKRLDYDKIYDEERDYDQYLSVFARW
ncbi:MAG TPA: capsule assembly Wzi family protein, partial [Sphingobacteriaceae bacterium]